MSQLQPRQPKGVRTGGRYTRRQFSAPEAELVDRENHPWVVYGLRLADSDQYRYVGLTRIGVRERLAMHLRAVRNPKNTRRHVYDWLRANEGQVVADVLEAVEIGDEESLFAAEVRWIQDLRAAGHDLTNHADGGASGSYGARWTLRPEQVRRGEAHPNFGREFGEEHRIKAGAKNKGSVRSVSTRQKQGDSIRGEKHWRAQLSDEEAYQYRVRAVTRRHLDIHEVRGYGHPDCAICVELSADGGPALSTRAEVKRANNEWARRVRPPSNQGPEDSQHQQSRIGEP